MKPINEELNEESIEETERDIYQSDIEVMPEMVKIDREQIEKEEFNKIKNQAMFSGYDIRENHFKFDN